MTNSVDEDILRSKESMASRQCSLPITPPFQKAVEQVASDHSVRPLSIREASFPSLTGRKTISGSVKNTTFKSLQTNSGTIQHHMYHNISTGLCQIPTVQAMAIVGLRSNSKVKDNDTSISEGYEPSGGVQRPKKSFTFSCGPLVQSHTTSTTANTEDIFPSLLVASSSPNLSPQILSTRSTVFANITPITCPDSKSSKGNLISNPVFENPRPHAIHIPVEIVNSPSKG